MDLRPTKRDEDARVIPALTGRGYGERSYSPVP